MTSDSIGSVESTPVSNYVDRIISSIDTDATNGLIATVRQGSYSQGTGMNGRELGTGFTNAPNDTLERYVGIYDYTPVDEPNGESTYTAESVYINPSDSTEVIRIVETKIKTTRGQRGEEIYTTQMTPDGVIIERVRNCPDLRVKNPRLSTSVTEISRTSPNDPQYVAKRTRFEYRVGAVIIKTKERVEALRTASGSLEVASLSRR